MFFCEDCRKKKAWPPSIGRSEGRCEVCKITKLCHNVPSSRLQSRRKDAR